ncbi:MAG: hypothetical protein ACI82G_001830 [Bradymonadia bacterium]
MNFANTMRDVTCVLALVASLVGCNASRSGDGDTVAVPDATDVADVADVADVEAGTACENDPTIEHRYPSHIAAPAAQLRAVNGGRDGQGFLAIDAQSVRHVQRLSGAWSESELEVAGPLLDPTFPTWVDQDGRLWGRAEGGLVVAELSGPSLAVDDVWRPTESELESVWISATGRVFANAGGLHEIEVDLSGVRGVTTLLASAAGALVADGGDGFWGFEEIDGTTDLLPFRANVQAETGAVAFEFGSVLVSPATVWTSAYQEPNGSSSLFGLTEDFALVRCTVVDCQPIESAATFLSRLKPDEVDLQAISLPGEARQRLLVGGHTVIDVFGSEATFRLVGRSPAIGLEGANISLVNRFDGSLVEQELEYGAPGVPLVIPYMLSGLFWMTQPERSAIVGTSIDQISTEKPVLAIVSDSPVTRRRPELLRVRTFSPVFGVPIDWSEDNGRLVALAEETFTGVLDPTGQLVVDNDLCASGRWLFFLNGAYQCTGDTARFVANDHSIDVEVGRSRELPTGVRVTTGGPSDLAVFAGFPRGAVRDALFFPTSLPAEINVVMAADELRGWRIAADTPPRELEVDEALVGLEFDELYRLGPPANNGLLLGGGREWFVARVVEDTVRLEFAAELERALTVAGRNSDGVTLRDDEGRVWFWDAAAERPVPTMVNAEFRAWGGDFDQDGVLDILVEVPDDEVSVLFFGDCWENEP